MLVWVTLEVALEGRRGVILCPYLCGVEGRLAVFPWAVRTLTAGGEEEDEGASSSFICITWKFCMLKSMNFCR